MTITAYENYWETDKPFYITTNEAIRRIKEGSSKDLIALIRGGQQELKKNLPCILFSGKFIKRKIDGISEQSNLICLDFDKVDGNWKEYLKQFHFIYAAWVSPSGNGVKALVKLATNDHLGHFNALCKDFPNLDKSCKDISRICFESYDPDIYVNEAADSYDKTAVEEKKQSVSVTIPIQDENLIYSLMKKWAERHGEFFVEGNRNNFITKMAAFANRTGISEGSCKYLLGCDYCNTDFSREELERTIQGVYKRYSAQHATAQFSKDDVYETSTGSVYGSKELLEAEIEIEDIIYFKDVFQSLKDLRNNGQMKGETTFFPKLDEKFRYSRMDVTVISGFGNVGKSTFITQLDLIQAKKTGKKFAVFSPENYPTEHYYKDIVQMYVGKTVEKGRSNSMSDLELEEAYDFVNEHFFYIYPKNDRPTPAYILKRFTEVKIKHNIDGFLIDPFNQMSHPTFSGRDDKYLEEVLPTFKRFAQNTDSYFRICVHPTKPSKNKEGGYDCPTYFDLAGGAMWPNMIENILAYHRPFFFTDKMNPACQIHSQKIKKQQRDGILGITEWHYDYKTFRFRENGFSPLDTITYVPQHKESNEAPF